MRKLHPLSGDGIPLLPRYGYTAIYSFLLFLCLTLFLAGCKKDAEPVASEETYPSVVATYPASNQKDVEPPAKVEANFNVPLTQQNAKGIRFYLAHQGTTIGGTVSYEGRTAYFLPDSELQENTIYEARVMAEVVDAKGKTHTSETGWQFATKDKDQYVMSFRSNAVTDFVRDGTRSMQVGNYLYSFGGWNVPEESYNDVYRSSGDLTVWEKRPDAPWHGRHVYGIAKMNNYTYVIGGDNLHSVFDVWRTADGENWVKLADNLMENRIYYGCTAHNGYLYVIGGLWHNDVWRSKDGINWNQVADDLIFLNGENFAGSLISFNGRLWMICGGGSGGGTGTPRKTVWSSADGIHWKKEPDFGGAARYYTDLCVWDNKIWVVGGYNYDEGNVKSIWYMGTNGKWTEFPTPDNYLGRHATGVAVYNNQLVITCGNYNNDCWVIQKTN